MYRVFEIMLQISMLCKLLEKLRLKNSHIYTGKLNPAIWRSLADVIINDSHSVIIVSSVCLVFSFTQWLQVPVWYLAPPWVNWIPLQSVVYLLIIADGGDLWCNTASWRILLHKEITDAPVSETCLALTLKPFLSSYVLYLLFNSIHATILINDH